MGAAAAAAAEGVGPVCVGTIRPKTADGALNGVDIILAILHLLYKVTLVRSTQEYS